MIHLIEIPVIERWHLFIKTSVFLLYIDRYKPDIVFNSSYLVMVNKTFQVAVVN